MKNRHDENEAQNPVVTLYYVLLLFFALFGLMAVYHSLVGSLHTTFSWMIVSIMTYYFSLRVNETLHSRLSSSYIPVVSIIFWATSLIFLVNLIPIPLEGHYSLENALALAIVFGFFGLMEVCYRVYTLKKQSEHDKPKRLLVDPKKLFTKTMLFKVVPLWLAPFRVLLSSVAYTSIRPEDSPIIWIVNDSFLIVLASATIFIVRYIKDYIEATLKRFNYSENSLLFSLFVPFMILFTVFLYGSIDSVLDFGANPIPKQIPNVYAWATLVRNAETYLQSVTIFDIQGNLFIGYNIVLLMVFLSIANLVRVFISLKTLLFRGSKRSSYDRLHLIICTIILIVISIWSLFAVALFVIPEAFSYTITTPNRLIFDAFYFACTSWMIGSLDIEPSTVLSRLVVLISTISNILFFVVFITGLFSDADEKTGRRKRK